MSIIKVSKMCGNPMFTLTNEGYDMAINGNLPEQITEALDQYGVIVLENKETEKMMFLVSEPEQLSEAKKKLDPVGEEDDDIDNDGKSNTKSDKYLKHRRKAISTAMRSLHKKKKSKKKRK